MLQASNMPQLAISAYLNDIIDVAHPIKHGWLVGVVFPFAIHDELVLRSAQFSTNRMHIFSLIVISLQLG